MRSVEGRALGGLVDPEPDLPASPSLPEARRPLCHRAGLGEPVTVADRGVLGGFKRSSQHLLIEVEVCDDEAEAASVGSGRSAMYAVAGSSAGAAGSPAIVLAQVAEGLSSEDAALGAGVSMPVGTRWFRNGGGMSPLSLVPPSGRYLSFAEREEIALHAQKLGGVRSPDGWVAHRRRARVDG